MRVRQTSIVCHVGKESRSKRPVRARWCAGDGPITTTRHRPQLAGSGEQTWHRQPSQEEIDVLANNYQEALASNPPFVFDFRQKHAEKSGYAHDAGSSEYSSVIT
jgi:hypothetical protein